MCFPCGYRGPVRPVYIIALLAILLGAWPGSSSATGDGKDSPARRTLTLDRAFNLQGIRAYVPMDDGAVLIKAESIDSAHFVLPFPRSISGKK